MNKTQIIGKQGESYACDFYVKNNYKILERNWVFGHLEIDIIAKNQDTIVFCEVKTRSSDCIVSPQEAVNKLKQKNIIRAANVYICKNGISFEARFDIITVLIKGEDFVLEHFPGAYTPNW